MSREKWESLNRKELEDLAQRKGITGVTRKTKAKLISALARLAKAKEKVKQKTPSRIKSRVQPQRQAAHYSNGTTSVEEQIERSKYDVGKPTKDLSAKVPKNLPKGYGN